MPKNAGSVAGVGAVIEEKYNLSMMFVDIPLTLRKVM